MSFWNNFRKKVDKEKRDKHGETLWDTDELFLHCDLQENLHQIRQAVGNSPDVIIREFEIGSPQAQVAVVYIDGLADKNMVSDFVLRSLMLDTAEETFKNRVSDKSIFDFIKDNALTVGEVKVIKDWKGLILSIFSGDTVILVNGWVEVIGSSTRGGESRGIEEPSSQVVIRGPKDGFSESIGTNISLVRRRIKSPNLWFETLKIGKVTQTDVAIMYVKGIVNDKLVQEVRQRINDIEIDGILESGYIEELIQDETFSPFPTLYNTERPDGVAANLLEGRIAIFVDGTPFVLLAPTTFFMYFQSTEDYYHRYDIIIAIRLLRFLAFFISLLGPSVFVAAVTFHQEMIPTPLLINLAAQRENVPFPAFVEALLMEVSFEILREAGIRLPRAIGQSVSIVGGLVLGQAAVQAGIVSPAMVIVVAITGIASFATPAFNMAISVRLFRFVIIIFAALFGFYGIAISNLIIIGHLCSLRSFGIPYMAPLAPFISADQKDAILRLPLWSFLTRPRLISQNKITRMEQDLKPSPPEKKGIEMKTKWVILTVLLFGLVLLMAGCWNSRELNKLAIVMAMGIDKVEQTNEYKVSFQVVSPGAVAPGATGGGAGANAASAAVFTGVGKNLFEAIRKTSEKVPRQLFFSHMQLLVIGEAVAKEGIQEVFDFFDRGHEARLTTKVLVTRGVEAGAMLKILTPLESIPANAHTGEVELAGKLWSENVNNEIDDVIKALVVEGREPIISGAKIVGNLKEGKKKSNMEQTDPQALVEIKGVALFKEGKLKRWVDGNEIRGILRVQNKMKSTIMNIDCKDEKDAIGIEVIRSKTDVTTEVQAGRPVIHIDIRQEGNVGEVRCPIDLTKQEEITKLEKEWIRETKREVIKAVEIAQSEKSDIFGFGEAVKRADPKTWEKMRKEWSKTFAVSKVDVKVDAFIRRPGMRTKPYLSDLKK